MITMMAGLTAILLGLIFLYFLWQPFITVILAGVPLILLLGGALATYLGIEEWRDTQSMKETGPTGYQSDETERYKAEAEKYKAELEAMKQTDEPETASPQSEDA